jgi:hypothetical protein
MIRRRLAPGLLAVALFALPSVAHAVPTDGERLFREGRTAMQSADYDTACARFAESQRKEPAPGTSLNLGECEERRNRLIAARDAFTSAASAFTTADKKGYALGRAEALDKRIPKVVLRISGASPKGVVVRAGERVVELGVELRFDPGEVTFSVEAPASRTKKQVASLKESNAVTEIELGPLDIDGPAKPKSDSPVVAPRRDESASSGGNGLRTVGLVLVGVGAASLVVGGVTGIMTLGRASTVKDHCDGDLACDSEGASAASSGQTLSLVSTITVIAGVVGVGAGSVLLLTTPSKKTASTTIGPGPGDLGLMMRRSF